MFLHAHICIYTHAHAWHEYSTCLHMCVEHTPTHVCINTCLYKYTLVYVHLFTY